MIPLEDFFRKPDRISLQLSPDGSRLAWMAPWERRLNVYVRDLDTGEESRVTAATERDIAGFVWVSNQRLLYVQDTGGDENHRLYAVSHDGSNPLDLTPYENVKCSIVDDLEEIDDQILFQMNRRNPERFDVYRLDTNSGDTTLVAENPGTIQGWITDHDGRLRLATTTDGVNTSILYRPTESDPWQTVATYDFMENATPLHFLFDRNAIWVASNVQYRAVSGCSSSTTSATTVRSSVSDSTSSSVGDVIDTVGAVLPVLPGVLPLSVAT